MSGHTATYSPEDNKIRLFFAYRIPRPEWDALRAAGWSWTMKQDSIGKEYTLEYPAPMTMCAIDAERIPAGSYRMPTMEERQAFKDSKKSALKGQPLVNPDEEATSTMVAEIDARQAAAWALHSSEPYKPLEVRQLTSEEWQALASRSDTYAVRRWGGVRIRSVAGLMRWHQLVVLTDKPRKPLPVAAGEASRVAV